MKALHYSNQVDLLLSILGNFVEHPEIALKGGTAINLFLLNMPRLSVDIDLTFLPILPREESLRSITNVFEQAQEKILKRRDIRAEIKCTKDGVPKQMLIRRNETTVKVEINLILRGAVYEPSILPISKNTLDQYGKEMSVRCLSFEDLYAGKFCAALDRQHPRDLFDIYYFNKKYELTERLKNAFIVYLLSSNRPVHEIIRPSLLNQKEVFLKEFDSMADEKITYKMLEDVRSNFIDTINNSLSENDKKFILSFEQGQPNWHLFPLDKIQEFPAIKWKLHNISQMDASKRSNSVEQLSKKLGI